MIVDASTVDRKQVALIPTDRIRILNPRVRNRRNFEEIVENIARIGLKRPITVSIRAGAEPPEYDLVCGQGRLEAFVALGQAAIPAIVIDADESDCLVMSLVENGQDRRQLGIREHDCGPARKGRGAARLCGGGWSHSADPCD